MQKNANFFIDSDPSLIVLIICFGFFYVSHLPHEMDVVHRVAVFVHSEFETVDHWVESTFSDIRVFA